MPRRKPPHMSRNESGQELVNSIVACANEVQGAVDAVLQNKDDEDHAFELAISLLPPASKDVRNLHGCCKRLARRCGNDANRTAMFAASDGLRAWMDNLMFLVAEAATHDDDEDAAHAVLENVIRNEGPTRVRLDAIRRIARIQGNLYKQQ